MNTENFTLPQALAHSLLSRTMAPYKPTNTDYLLAADVLCVCDDDDISSTQAAHAIIKTRGKFSIPHSCYIESTGHFNAVEYLICFNQLAYSTFAHMVAEDVLRKRPFSRVSETCRSEIGRVSLEKFFEKQLSSMLILKTETRFKRIIDASSFEGELTVRSLIFRSGTVFAQTDCRFTDPKGGYAEGDVLLAYPTRLL